VLALSMAYVAFGGLRWVQAAFYGVGPVVIGVIAVAAIRLGSRVVKRDPLLIAILVVVGLWTSISQREIVALFVLSGALTLVIRRADWQKAGVLPAVIPAGLAIVPPVASSTALLLYFAKASLFVFGSGLAIVPFLYAGVVHDRHWLSDRQFIDAVAVAMITPGPVVITVAFIGYLVDGFAGAVAAAIGIFTPVYLMVVVCAPVFRRYSEHARLRAFVSGVTAAAAGAIAGAVVVLAGRTIHDVTGVCLAAATVPILLRWKVPEPALIGVGGLIGVVVQSMGGLP
jgi:chromate transporter